MRVLSFALSVLLLATAPALAAKRKPAAPALSKPSYEQPMRVVIVRNSSPDCEPTCPEWIAAEGEILADTPDQFRTIFARLGERKLPVILRSPGGSIEAALEIGQMIRRRGLVTGVSNTLYRGCSPFDATCSPLVDSGGIYVGSLDDTNGFCNSACPMILAGGVERYVGGYSSIGVHEPKTVWTREHVRYRETYKLVRGKKKVVSRKVVSRKQLKDRVTYGLDKRLRRQLSKHYSSLGVSTDILKDTVKAKYNDIHFVANDRLDELRLRTSAKSASSFSVPSACTQNHGPAHCVTDLARRAAVRQQVEGIAARQMVVQAFATTSGFISRVLLGLGEITEKGVRILDMALRPNWRREEAALQRTGSVTCTASPAASACLATDGVRAQSIGAQIK